jgi:hypothetical protein
VLKSLVRFLIENRAKFLMMKFRHILPLIFLFASLTTMAQYRGDLRIGIYGQTTVTNHEMVEQFGISGEYFVLDNFGLVYKYGFGVDPYGKVSGHINPGILVLALFIPYSVDAIFASALICEGVSYHFRPMENLEFAPYVSPLGAEINLPGEKEFVLSLNSGMKLNFLNTTKLNNFLISADLGVLYIYGSQNAYPSLGISLNYQF